MNDIPNPSEWQGWTHWIEQELAKTPDDDVLIFMKELMEYCPELDIPTAEDLRNDLKYRR